MNDIEKRELLLDFIKYINHKQNCKKEYDVITNYPHPRILNKNELIDKFLRRKNGNGN